ncbi:hypothetical protein JCM8208_007565 [Rhodotorula glutinis]
MSVTLSPSNQLGFQRPLTQLVKRSLSVSNHNSQAVAYKVKTTAPKQYCVRPNSGRIEPGETVEVQVLLQPMKEDPAPGARCRDKFLVQSVAITPEREDVALAELWSGVEQEDKSRGEAAPSQIHEQKIRCAYLPAAEHGSIPEETSSHETPRALHVEPAFASAVSPSSHASSTPTQSSTTLNDASPSPGQYHQSQSAASSPSPAIADKARDVAAGAAGAAAGAAAAVGLPGVANAIERNAPIQSSGGPAYLSASSPSGAAAPAPSSSTSTSHTTTTANTGTTGAGSDELSRLRSELASTKAELARVKQQLDASETTAATLRSRGAGAGGAGAGAAGKEASTAQAVVELKGQEGVPVQVVAGLMFAAVVVT